MANRREFLQGSVAASLLAFPPGLLAALASRSDPALPPLYKVLADARHEASLRFADAFAGEGVAVYRMANGNLTRFWRNELAAVWARSPAPVAGLTDASVLFCLEQLGWQHGLRVLHREERESGLVAWVVAPRRV